MKNQTGGSEVKQKEEVEKPRKMKEQAREQLLSAMQTAFNYVTESGTIPKKEQEKLLDEMSKQMERVEILFGYVPKSWNRGI